MGKENTTIISLTENIRKRLIGKDDVIRKVIICLIAQGHVLLEDVPGVGKTSLAKALADSISVSFSRIQCTPDTTPADITGLSIYSSSNESFQIVPGPVNNNIVLADELNRTSPKTQSALLEVMEEHRITIDGKDIPVPEPFMVIGTQNPSQMAGTYPLPEASLDRFMMKLSVGYPDSSASEDMAKRFLEGSLHEKTESVCSGQDILEMQKECQKVTIHDNLRAYAVQIIEATRNKAEVSCGASPRALLSLLRCAQAIAYIDGRDYCIPEDIAEAAKLSIPHRLVLSTESKLSKVTKEDIVNKILTQVKVP
ncbi:AAA family ATPase [Butyrivibrio proteoclasticus]|uniref:AAA family ATPase n=1 Tax=Butyrivibrio proteoclasticus TaxID=43305 RepID=UPI00047AD76B|nr:MoxR family ATPase [Butyrivibrio proteoclasticus]